MKIFPIKKFRENSLKLYIKIGNVNICADIDTDTTSLIFLGNLYNFLFSFLLNNIIPKVAKKDKTNPKLNKSYGLTINKIIPAKDIAAIGL